MFGRPGMLSIITKIPSPRVAKQPRNGIIGLYEKVKVVIIIFNLGRMDGMDHATRELLGNILGLLEIMKKDIKEIKHEISVINSRQEGTNILSRGIEESRQQIKVLDEKKKSSCPVSDQLKSSRLK